MPKPQPVSVEELAAPARYLPWLRQRDLLAPGMYRFGHDFANGPVDQRVFQIDREFYRYQDNMLQARQQLEKYYCQSQRPTEINNAVNQFLIKQLCVEYPAWFSLKDNALQCKLTDEIISLNNPQGYRDLFDAIASQVQEDIAVMQFDNQGNNRLCALHLCCPNHWGANQRIGENFFALHKPVPGLNTAISDADTLLKNILQRGPYVRFVWGLTNNTVLNMHPENAQTNKQLDTTKELFARIERQVLYGLPEVNALLFIIRTSFVAVSTLSRDERAALWKRIETTNEALLHYKGIQDCKESHFK